MNDLARTLTLGAGLLLIPLAVGAHEFTAPDVVEADATGCFSYDLSIMVGPGDTEFCCAFTDDAGNTDNGETYYDAFCSPESEGEEIVITVVGCLQNPNEDGYVYGEMELCSPFQHWDATTTIVPTVVATPDVAAAERLGLVAAPNPMRSGTTLELEVPGAGQAAVTIFDASGRLVRRLLDESLAAGRHTVQWDASSAAPGVYFARLETAAGVAVRRIIRIP